MAEFNKYNKTAIIIVLFFLLVLYVINGLYAHPVADDYSYAYLSQKGNILQTWLHEYTRWNGRYTSNVFVLSSPLLFKNLWCYKIIPFLLIALTIIVIYTFIKNITKKTLDRLSCLIITLFLSLLYFGQMPNLPEGIYWYTGAVTYHLGNIVFLYLINLFILYVHEDFLLNNKGFHISLLILAVILVIGFNEVIMLSTFSLILVLLVVEISNKGTNKELLLVLLVIALACGIIMYFSQCNAISEKNFTGNHKLLYSLLMSGAQIIRFGVNWVLSFPLLLLSFLYFFVNKQLSSKVEVFSKSFYITPAISAGLLLYTIFIGTFPAYWATNIQGQHRTVNVSYWLFIFLWFINLTVIFNRYFSSNYSLTKKQKVIIYIALVFSFFLTKNGGDVFTDLYSGKSSEYNKFMNERLEQLNNVTDNDTIYFRKINTPPKSLFVLDITTDDPSYWTNRCYNLFYKTGAKILLSQ